MARHYTSLLLFACCFLTAGWASGQSAMGPWSNTGPVAFPTNVSGQIHGIGRVSQFKFHPTSPAKIYAVSASGGVFLTADTGRNWAPLAGTEKLPQTSSSSLCINYSNDQTLYLCLGDADYYSNDYGIYKSTNGGTSWATANSGIGTNMAVEILMDPTDTSKLVAATKGGMYRSTNGGGSWTQVQAGAFTDMKAKPVTGGSQTLYAATSTAFYYSTNFGATWTATTITLPTANTGIRIAVSANDTSRVYLATTKGNGVILKSTSSGTSFTQVYNSSSQCIVCYDGSTTSGSQGNYNIDLTANPANANELLIIAHCVWRSTNGGVTWSKRTNWYENLHTDMHQAEWNPYNNSQIWTANDGGMWVTTDTLASNWNQRSDGLAASEIYHAAQSPVVKELISVGTQDNGELYYTNGAWKTNRGGDWTTPCAIDYRGNGTVWYLAKGTRRNLLPLGSDQNFSSPYSANGGTFVQSERGRIAFPKAMPAVAFMGRDSIYRCTNINSTFPFWQRILTTSEEVRAIESCAADTNILYVATNAGHLFRSDNAMSATPTFTQLNTPAGTSTTSSIATSPFDSQVVFISCGASIYRSVNKGATWTNITGTGLSGINIRKIIYDDYSPRQRLFVNAGAYVHYKDSTTTAWTNHTATAGLPTVANATDFMVYNDSSVSSILRLSTFGRGIWECGIRNDLPPVADFSANRTNACPGDTVRFTHAVSGSFTSLSWSFPGGTPGSSTALAPVVVYAGAGSYNVTLTATNANGSHTVTKTAYIITSGQTAQIAEGFEGTAYPPAGWRLQNTTGTNWDRTNAASGFGTGINSIFWNNFATNASGLRDAILPSKVDLTGLANARLKFDVAYAPYGAAYPDSLQVRISTNCGTTWTVLYSKTGTALATAPTYTAAAFVPTATQWRTDSVSLLPYVGQSVLLSFDNIGHYGQQLFLDNINVLLSPKAKFGGAGSSLCTNVPVTFTDSSTNVISRAWTFTGGTPASSAAQNPVVTYSTPGSYTARLIVTNSLGSDTLSKTVVVSNGFVVNLGNDTSVCPGSSVTLNAGTGGSSYLFSNGATTQTTTVSTAGTYSVAVTSANGCTVRDTLVITAAPAPTVNLGPDTTVCNNTTLTLNAGNAGSSFLWSNGTTTQSATVSTAGTYSVRVTNAAGCIGRDTLVVSAATAPTVSLGPDVTFCPGGTATLNAGNAGSSFLWSNGTTTQSATVSTAGTYHVRVTNAAGCIGRDTLVVATGSNPVVSLGADATICSGSSITLNAGNAGSSFLWSTGATSQSVLATTAGTYSVRVTNANGCIGRDTIAIATGTSPLVNLGPDTAICPGTFITLSAGNTGATFLYSNGATTQSTSVSMGTYNVQVTNAAGCTTRDTIVISALPAPLVSIGPDAVLCPGETRTLDAGTGGISYLFSNGATTQTTTVSAAGTYSVTVTGANGCRSSDTLIITPGTLPTGSITAAGSLLMAGSTGVSYQWFRNGVAIAGAVNASYTATQSGVYTVRVTNAQGCTGVSPAFEYVSIGVTTALKDAGYDLFPNPTTGIFTITGKGIGASEVSVRCYNAAGAFVREERLPVSGGLLNADLNWSNLARGSYNVVIRAGTAEGVQTKVVIR